MKIITKEDYSFYISEFSTLLKNLFETNPYSINDILTKHPIQFDVDGVYVISTPSDDEIVYVGKTKTKSVKGRLIDHCNIGTTSDLKGILQIKIEYPQEVRDYLVRCIEIRNSDERSWFEYFAIGVLKPTFNK